MRYLMVYTGNEVNMCTTEGADKHSSFGVQRMHIHMKIYTLLLCKYACRMLRHKWCVKLEDIQVELHLYDDLSHMKVYGKCAFSVFFMVSIFVNLET